MQMEAQQIDRTQIADKEKRYPAVKALNDETLDKPRGFILPVERGWEICGSEDEFKRVVGHWKECVQLILGIFVKYSHKHRGYEFVTTDQHMKEVIPREQRAIEKKLRTTSTRLAMIHDDDLGSVEEKRLRLFLVEQASAAAGRMNADRERARIAFERPETLPCNPMIEGNGKG